VVLDSGTANLASMLCALRRLGSDAIASDERAVIDSARLLVLPGVGSFAAGMAQLEERDLSSTIVRRIAAGRPTLAVCLGLQLLCDGSEESPGVSGLGILPVGVKRFVSGAIRVPQIGFNRVEPEPGSGLTAGYAYYANSYRIADTAPLAAGGWRLATSDHGGRFVAAVEKGAVLACQFHPELSGAWGNELLARWIDQHGRERASSATEAQPC
jgi:imidazole glycerol phosphate synthase glutamine amidotransferase subunit